MKVKKLIEMLEDHNLDAEIKFFVNFNKSPELQIASKAICKCTEKEIEITIGN